MNADSLQTQDAVLTHKIFEQHGSQMDNSDETGIFTMGVGVGVSGKEQQILVTDAEDTGEEKS